MSKNITAKRFGHEVFKPVNSGADFCPDLSSWIKSLKLDPARAAAVLCDLRRPNGVSRARYGLALHIGGRQPILNADKQSIERSLAKHFDERGSKHAKLKMFRKVELKPDSPAAAKIAGTWAQQRWEVWTLKYSPGLVIRNHRGEESDVFKGWGSMKKTLEGIGFKIVK